MNLAAEVDAAEPHCSTGRLRRAVSSKAFAVKLVPGPVSSGE